MKSEYRKKDRKKISTEELIKLNSEMEATVLSYAMKVSSKKEKNYGKLKYLKKERARVMGEISSRNYNE